MPRHVLTPAQIAGIPKALAAGESKRHLAQRLGVDRTTILHHARRAGLPPGGGKGGRPAPTPWKDPLRLGRRALRRGNRALASAHYLTAALALAPQVVPPALANPGTGNQPGDDAIFS